MSEIQNLGNIDDILAADNVLLSPEIKTKRVILRGPVFTQSGYGTHARQVARWLFNKAETNGMELFVEPLHWGITPWMVNPDACGGLIGKMVQHSQQKADSYDVSLQLQLPNEWNPFLANYNIGITAGVETTVCNPEWINAINQMDLVIVPSEFTKRTFESTGQVTTKILVVPESFPDEILDEKITGADVDLSAVTTDFNFLIFGQITGNNPDNDRKNLAYTIKWLCEEFKDEENVGVIVKTNLGRNSVLDKNNTTNTLAKLLTETKKGPGPKFYLLHGDLDEKEVAALYKHPKVKALVSLTRGEGFGLPLLEAAASGLPVIATNWSAHTEFLNLGKFVKIDYKLAPIHQSRIDNKIFLDGMAWAYPDESDAKRKLKRFYGGSSIPTSWAQELAPILKQKYCFDAISKHYDSALSGIL